jgi:hypothetical protein
VPELADLPAGCAFAERCGHVRPVCRASWPALVDVAASAEAMPVPAGPETSTLGRSGAGSSASSQGIDHQARCLRLAELDQDRAEVARG